MIIYTFSAHFLLQPSQKSASKYIFCEICKDFSFFHPLNAIKLRFSSKKRPLKFNSGLYLHSFHFQISSNREGDLSKVILIIFTPPRERIK